MSPFRTRNVSSRWRAAFATVPPVPRGLRSVIHVIEGWPRRARMNGENVSSRYGEDRSTSPTPCVARWSRTWSRNGRSTSGTRGLGIVSVRGRMRVPSPPTRTTAFTLPPAPAGLLLAPPPGDKCGPGPQRRPGEGPERTLPSGRAELHEVAIDALGVHQGEPSLPRAHGAADVHDLQLGREEDTPTGRAEARADVQILDVHPVALVQQPHLVEGRPAQKHR